MISNDFKKAFDSASRDFLFRTRSAFHFGTFLYNGFTHLIKKYKAVF